MPLCMRSPNFSDPPPGYEPPREPCCTADREVGKLWGAPTPRAQSDGFVMSIKMGKTTPHKTPGAISAASFSADGELLATLDAHGQVVVFHLSSNRYVTVRRGGVRGVGVAFSPLRRTELFVALADGTIECVDTASKKVLGSMRGHAHPAGSLACHPSRSLLLSCAADAAILWDSSDFSRVRALPGRPRALQHALFMPSGEALLTCSERSLTLWGVDALEPTATLRLPSGSPGSDALRLRCAAVTLDSRVVVGGGEGNWLALWSANHHSLARMVLLPDAVARVSWLSALPTSDASVHVALTCNDGQIRVVDANAPAVVSTLPPHRGNAALSASVDPTMRHLAAVCNDGTLALYQLVALGPAESRPTRPLRSFRPLNWGGADEDDAAAAAAAPAGLGAPVERPTLPPALPKDWERSTTEVQGVSTAGDLRLGKISRLQTDSALLDARKLDLLVRTCGAFPAKYRPYVWRFALRLPNNVHAYAALLGKGPHAACLRLHARLPLADRRGVGRLERLLSCLAHWCPLFAQVGELPAVVYPWLQAFGGDELSAFEASATVLSNWGHAFYEYHPNPPVGVLTDAAAILSARAPGLYAHLVHIGAGPDAWAWPLLGSFFARVLPRADWLVLWDHLLAAEPHFILFVRRARTLPARVPGLCHSSARLTERAASALSRLRPFLIWHVHSPGRWSPPSSRCTRRCSRRCTRRRPSPSCCCSPRRCRSAGG